MRSFLVTILFTGSFTFQSTDAQVPVEDDSVSEGWRSRLKARATIERNDNVFRLSTNQQNTMALNDSGIAVSGRFRNMESISDVVASTLVDFEVTTKAGLFGRPFSISARLDYGHYFQNQKRDHVEFELTFLQNLSKRNRVEIRSNYLPSFFVKNYLADAIDLTGSVSDGERVYEAGVYSEWNVTVDYRHQIRKLPVDLDVVASHRSQTYKNPFKGRSENAVDAGLTITVDVTKQSWAGLGYIYEVVKSPVEPEVLVLDEPDYGIDFNNDRDFVDNNRRTVQTVDRSHHSHEFAFSSSIEGFENFVVLAGLKYIIKDYTSREPIDPRYKDRKDKRITFDLGFDYRVVSGVHFRTEYKRVTQTTNRPQDPGSLGEITDYEINIIRAGIAWRLF